MDKNIILEQCREMESQYYKHNYDFLEQSELKESINSASVVRVLNFYSTYGSMSYSFEGEKCEILLCQTAEGKCFLRINWHKTSAESNGRPESEIKEWCYMISDKVDKSLINEVNWKDYLQFGMILIKWENICGVSE